MNKFIVTTTIYPPTEAMLRFSRMKDWGLIIVGDLKTPHQEYEGGNWIYLHPDYQAKTYPALSDAIGWNCIMRRNIGFIEAYRRGADIIATVDDDNIPYDSWGKDVHINKTIEVDTYSDSSGIFDPLHVTNVPEIWHRGYPIGLVKTRDSKYLGKTKVCVKVQADLWDGDPDIDAMCRLVSDPLVKFDKVNPYTSMDFTPFNSQNTFLAREIIPLYMVLPHVGRVDDIWASYIVEHLLGIRPVFCSPTVYQARNPQSVITNLEREIFGYSNTLNFVRNISDFESLLPSKALVAYNMYRAEFYK